MHGRRSQAKIIISEANQDVCVTHNHVKRRLWTYIAFGAFFSIFLICFRFLLSLEKLG